MIYLTIASSLIDGLREGFYMFWETGWALVLGFGLSGAVQSFVTRKEMEKTLGDHKPKTIAKASVLGMASSSCSYAATAMAKSLFSKGADFLAAMSFMFASANLVVELGIVIVVLLGWQFFAAEFIGGPIMIALLVMAGSVTIAPALIQKARNGLRRSNEADFDQSNGASQSMAQFGDAHNHGNHPIHEPANNANKPLYRLLKDPALWADAASYATADLKMLRKEILIGYLIAGYLATIVPTSIWKVVFISGHGTLTQIENALGA